MLFCAAAAIFHSTAEVRAATVDIAEQPETPTSANGTNGANNVTNPGSTSGVANANGAGGAAGAGGSKTLSFFSLSAETAWQTSADIIGGGGDFSAWSRKASVGYFYKNEENAFFANVSWQSNDYDFQGTPAWFADTESVAALLFYERKISSDWSLLANAGGHFSAATDARLSDGYSGFVGGGVRYRPTANLNFFGGLLVTSRIMDDPSWLPYAGIEWTIDKHWSLKTKGASLTLGYDVEGDGMLLFELAGTYRGGRYLLARDTYAGARRDRDLETREGVVTLAMTRTFFDRAAYLSAGVGALLYSKHKIRSHGHTIGEFRTDPAAVFHVEVGVRF
jgi:hypothetical protein